MSKITDSARGEMCQIRLPCCNRNPETTVACHINGAGMGLKEIDSELAYGCSDCHDVVDGRRHLPGWTRDMVLLAHHEAAARTRKILNEKGLMILL